MSSPTPIQEPNPEKERLLQRAEELKSNGNECFLGTKFDDARELYTQAIELLEKASQFNVITGQKLLNLRDEYLETERKRVFEIQQKKQINENNDNNDDDSAKPAESNAKMQPYEPPKTEFANELAIYHSNRAACMMKLMEGLGLDNQNVVIVAAGISYEAVIDDCDISLLHKPGYAKALLRRMAAFEKQEKYEEALGDAKEALINETKPSTKTEIQRHIKRLEKLYNEKMEKLKEETLGKLKDLGNSFLSNFGISLDQFKTEKDPNTGSYSVSFNQK